MKLADSWVEDADIEVPLEAFHDEVEEVDELDEAEDGCGGVVWQPYVLKKPHTSNKQLHKLAREIRGVEKKGGKEFTVRQYKTIFDKWESASRPFLQPGHEYFPEFLAKLSCVTIPKGETLQAAFERAKKREPPSEILIVRNPGVRLLASLCRELQEMAGDQPFMLHQLSAANLFGHRDHRNISNWLKVCKTIGLLKIAEPWQEGKATRYYFIG
jgi:hypothetical protein